MGQVSVGTSESARRRGQHVSSPAAAAVVTGPPGLVRRWSSEGRRRLQDFSNRPMTSFHLILGVFAVLLAFGLTMVLASSSVAALRSKTGNSFSIFENQTVFAVIGLFGFVVAMRISVRRMRQWSFLAVSVSFLLLAAVLVPGLGARYNGARSWIDFGSVSLQPSEPAKLALLLWMAHVLASRRHALRSPRALLIPVLPIFLCMCVLLMMQPALGTTITLSIVFFATLFFGGAPWWMFAGVAAVAGAAGTYLATSAGYRSARITGFLNPQAHPELNYQLTQGLYAMGRGGWFGMGLGQSTAKYGWLPNASSDFIFAIIGEELGFIGAALILILFAVLAYTGLRIARRNVDPFIKITAAAGTVWLVGQAVVNIGYVVGLLPVTGITLPMISTGGTSLVITMMVFGLLANFALREPHAAAARLSKRPGRAAAFLGMASPAERAARRGQARAATASRKRASTNRTVDQRQAPRAAFLDSGRPPEPARRRPGTKPADGSPGPRRTPPPANVRRQRQAQPPRREPAQRRGSGTPMASQWPDRT